MTVSNVPFACQASSGTVVRPRVVRGRVARRFMVCTVAAVMAMGLTGCGRGLGASRGALTTSSSRVTHSRARAGAHVLVRVESAVIAGTDPTTGAGWDLDGSAADAARRERDVGVLASLLGLAAPALGVLVEVVGALGAPDLPRDASPALPDPQISLSVARGISPTNVSSAVLANTTRPAWQTFAAWVRLSDLAGEDLTIGIDDADGADAAVTRIGTGRVSYATLERVAGGDDPEAVVLSDGALTELRVTLAPAQGLVARTSTRLDLREGLAASELAAPYGATVRVIVRGGGSVGSGFRCPGNVRTEGTSGCDSYCLAGLRGARHAVPFLMWGVGSTAQLVDVSAPEGECREVVAPLPGRIVVGINDSQVGNNSGAFEFTIEVSDPGSTARGSARPCGFLDAAAEREPVSERARATVATLRSESVRASPPRFGDEQTLDEDQSFVAAVESAE